MVQTSQREMKKKPRSKRMNKGILPKMMRITRAAKQRKRRKVMKLRDDGDGVDVDEDPADEGRGDRKWYC